MIHLPSYKVPAWFIFTRILCTFLRDREDAQRRLIYSCVQILRLLFLTTVGASVLFSIDGIVHGLVTRCTGLLGPVRLVVVRGGPQILQKSRSYLKILGARRVTWSRLHTEYLQILSAMVRNLVARNFCNPGHAIVPSWPVHVVGCLSLMFVMDLD